MTYFVYVPLYLKTLDRTIPVKKREKNYEKIVTNFTKNFDCEYALKSNAKNQNK